MAHELLPLSGRYWRMLGVRWQSRPFESGAHRTGGRWNPPGQRALYLSAAHGTAIMEMHQDLIRPGTLVAFDVAAAAIADLRKIDAAIAFCEWRRIFQLEKAVPPTWRIAEDLVSGGANGALIPSVQDPSGTNLVLWRWHDAREAEGEGAALGLLDPENMLGANDGQSQDR